MPQYRSRIVRTGDADPHDLKANQRNWRTHPIVQRRALEGLLTDVGWVQNVVVNARSMTIIDGHLRVETALKNGDETVPVVWVDLDDDEEALVLAALDPLAGLAGTDPDALRDLLGDVATNSSALEAMLADLAKQLPEPEPEPGAGASDEMPDVDAVPSRTAPGELWVLGRHRLILGDATDAATVEALLEGQAADMILTDPPYAMSYRSAKLGGIMNDDLDETKFVQLILGALVNAQAHARSGAAFYVCMGAYDYGVVMHQMRKLGLAGRPLVWVKPAAGLGQSDYRPQFEVIVYAIHGDRAERIWHGQRRERDVWELDARSPVIAREDGDETVLEIGGGFVTTQVRLKGRVEGVVIETDATVSDVWKVGRERGAYVHPTQKPVALLERALRNSSDPGSRVLDLFLGGGSTLMACEALERQCYGIELDPKWADVTIARWEAATGLTAERGD